MGATVVKMVCVTESVYESALTRGKLYEVLEADHEKRQIRIEGDNGRIRWFPNYCFCSAGTPVPTLVEYRLDDPIDEAHSSIDVVVRMSDGEYRWCTFITPVALSDSGCIIEAEGIQSRFHFGLQHFIIANVLTEELIGKILRRIDGQGELIHCTVPIGED